MNYIIAIVVLLLVPYLIYASIIRKRNQVNETFAGIDVQLVKRHDLIPNIVAAAKKFMEHESELFNDITSLRTQAVGTQHAKDPKGMKAALDAEAALSGKLSQLMVNVENYPTLKSDQTMIEVQKALMDVEENISAARRFYNSAVRNLNDTIQVWPMSLIAKYVHVEPYPFFEAKEAEKATPNVSKLMA